MKQYLFVVYYNNIDISPNIYKLFELMIVLPDGYKSQLSKRGFESSPRGLIIKDYKKCRIP